jgi:hypothetical protein
MIRAQLIEEGIAVVATDTWPHLRRHLRAGSKPGLVIIDLKGLQNPAAVLKDLRVLMKPDRVLVLTAIGTVAAAEIERQGFRQLARPVVIKEIVDTVAHMIHLVGPDSGRDR